MHKQKLELLTHLLALKRGLSQYTGDRELLSRQSSSSAQDMPKGRPSLVLSKDTGFGAFKQAAARPMGEGMLEGSGYRSRASRNASVSTDVLPPSRASPSPTMSHKTLGRILYSVGDAVDGLCVVQNGSERWFPGLVIEVSTCVESDQSARPAIVYTVQFMDGDVRTGLTTEKLRLTRSRSRTGSVSSPMATIRSGIAGGSANAPHVALYSSSPDVADIPTKIVQCTTETDLFPQLSSEGDTLTSQVDAEISMEGAGLDCSFDRESDVLGKSMDNSLGDLSSVQHVVDCTYSSDDCEEQDEYVFTIPVAFDRSESTNTLQTSGTHFADASDPPVLSARLEYTGGSISSSTSKIIVPKMHLADLDYSCAGSHGDSAFSLSGSLLREGSLRNVFDKKAVSQIDVFCGQSPRYVIDKVLSEAASKCLIASAPPPANDGNISPSSSSVNTHGETWKDLAMSRRDSGRSALSTSTGRPLVHAHTDRTDRLYGEDSGCEVTYRLDKTILQLQDELGAVSVTQVARFNVVKSFFVLCVHFLVNEEVSRELFVERTLETLPLFRMLSTIRSFLELSSHASFVPKLRSVAHSLGADGIRLFKICTDSLFAGTCMASHVSTGELLANGAFGSVKTVCCDSTCSLRFLPVTRNYVAKHIRRESAVVQATTLVSVFNEVRCLEVMATHIGVCGMHNYGIVGDDYVIVLERGLQDLLCFRRDLTAVATAPTFDSVVLLLLIFLEVIEIVKSVHSAGITHFDLKCSNVIVRRLPTLEKMGNCLDKGFVSGCVFLADFGEAVVQGDLNAYLGSGRARGTLSVQSPEMLCTNEQKAPVAKAVRFGAPGASSDVWSLGCLLFELLTANPLFKDMDWSEMAFKLCHQTFQLPLVNAALREVFGACSDSCVSFLTGAVLLPLRQDPATRITVTSYASEIKNYLECTKSEWCPRPASAPSPREASKEFSIPAPAEARDPHSQMASFVSQLTSVPFGLWQSDNNLFLKVVTAADSSESIKISQVTEDRMVLEKCTENMMCSQPTNPYVSKLRIVANKAKGTKVFNISIADGVELSPVDGHVSSTSDRTESEGSRSLARSSSSLDEILTYTFATTIDDAVVASMGQLIHRAMEALQVGQRVVLCIQHQAPVSPASDASAAVHSASLTLGVALFSIWQYRFAVKPSVHGLDRKGGGDEADNSVLHMLEICEYAVPELMAGVNEELYRRLCCNAIRAKWLG